MDRGAGRRWCDVDRLFAFLQRRRRRRRRGRPRACYWDRRTGAARRRVGRGATPSARRAGGDQLDSRRPRRTARPLAVRSCRTHPHLRGRRKRGWDDEPWVLVLEGARGARLDGAVRVDVTAARPAIDPASTERRAGGGADHTGEPHRIRRLGRARRYRDLTPGKARKLTGEPRPSSVHGPIQEERPPLDKTAELPRLRRPGSAPALGYSERGQPERPVWWRPTRSPTPNVLRPSGGSLFWNGAAVRRDASGRPTAAGACGSSTSASERRRGPYCMIDRGRRVVVRGTVRASEDRSL